MPPPLAQTATEAVAATLRIALAAGRSGAAAALARLNGPFAAGLTSADGRRTVVAVDRFSEHTMCLRLRDGRLQYAERADELAGPGTALDPQALFDYLYFHCIPAPRTVFCDVLRLPPGHFAWCEDGKLHMEPYWTPSFDEPASAPDFGALRDEFRGLLRTAVAERLRGGDRACFLSGGTDSSTVAGMIGLASGEQAQTYSIGFEAEGYDEMAYARIAARHFRTEHHEYYVTPADLVRSIPEVARHYDQPFGNSSALPAYYCARVAREHGVRHMLAGDGGDEVFGGNSRYAKQRVFGWYLQVPTILRSGLLEPLLLGSPLGALPGLKKGRSYIEQAKLPMPDRLETYNQLLRLGPAEVLTPHFLARVDLRAPQALQQQVWQGSRTQSEVNRTLSFDWRFTLADSDLPKVRGTTALAGVGVAFPFLDQRLLDFSLRLPADYKLKGLKLRWFFKEALRGFLPDEIITKKKQGFGLPFGVWLTCDAALMALARESLGSLSTRGIVQPAFLASLLDRRLAEHPGYYGGMVWVLMMLEQWLRAHAPDYVLEP